MTEPAATRRPGSAEAETPGGVRDRATSSTEVDISGGVRERAGSEAPEAAAESETANAPKVAAAPETVGAPEAADGSAPEERKERKGGAAPPRTFTPDFLTELFRNPLDPGYAEAAARKARGEGPAGARKRTLSGLTALTLVALGFLLVVAYQQTVEAEPARAQARQTLMDQIVQRRSTTSELERQADGLRGEVAGLRERQLGGAAVARLQQLEAQTGLAAVRGEGARITVADGPTPIDPETGKRSTLSRVRDTDLQRAANGLWAAGAEAIAINGQRLTATSTIRQAGEAILVDFRPVSTPYQVIAIGPGKLADNFDDSAAGRFFRALKSSYGMSYDVTGIGEVTLQAATEPILRQATASGAPAASASDEPTGTPNASGDATPASPSVSPTPSEGGR